MNLLTQKVAFKVDQASNLDGDWRVTITTLIKEDKEHFIIAKDGVVLIDEKRTVPASETFTPQRFNYEIAGDTFDVDVGYVSLTKRGCEIFRGGEILFRSHKKPFRGAGRLGGMITKLDTMADELENKEPTEEELAIAERQKALRPSIAIDFALGFVFFFIAREFGLLTASLTGSAVAVVLFVANRFTKVDLLGGFAVFGIVMSLISAVLTLMFQDDLFIKLKGTLMGAIGASFAIGDGIFNAGKYLGGRMAMYMEGLFKLNPRKAAFAMAGSMLGVMAIDTPLAFILSTEQWIWYNAFLDSIIGMAIFFSAMYFARETKRK